MRCRLIPFIQRNVRVQSRPPTTSTLLIDHATSWFLTTPGGISPHVMFMNRNSCSFPLLACNYWAHLFLISHTEHWQNNYAPSTPMTQRMLEEQKQNWFCVSSQHYQAQKPDGILGLQILSSMTNVSDSQLSFPEHIMYIHVHTACIYNSTCEHLSLISFVYLTLKIESRCPFFHD